MQEVADDAVAAADGVELAHVGFVDDGLHGLRAARRVEVAHDLEDVVDAEETVRVYEALLIAGGEEGCEQAVRLAFAPLVLAHGTGLRGGGGGGSVGAGTVQGGGGRGEGGDRGAGRSLPLALGGIGVAGSGGGGVVICGIVDGGDHGGRPHRSVGKRGQELGIGIERFSCWASNCWEGAIGSVGRLIGLLNSNCCVFI